jgi:DNA-binding LytR/AlgR family response regulator
VSALDFLLKPIRYNKFLAAVEKARQWYDRMEAVPEKNTPRQDDTIFIKVDGALRQISIASIMYVSGMKDYVMFWIIGERKALITHMTMKAVEDMLPAEQFMRVHRSYIVALNKIRSIDRNDCIYIGEEIIHVTQAYAEAFHNYLDQLTP